MLVAAGRAMRSTRGHEGRSRKKISPQHMCERACITRTKFRNFDCGDLLGQVPRDKGDR